MCSYPLEKWLVEENQLAEKDTKLYQLKAIEIPAEILKKISPSSERQESVNPSSFKNCSDLVSLTYAGYYFVYIVRLLFF